MTYIRDISSFLTKRPTTNKNLLFGGVSLFVITFIALGITYAHTIYQWADNMLLIPHAEAFTELYLDGTPTISLRKKHDAIVSFSFIITNREGKTVTYPYTIIHTLANKESIVLKKDSVRLEPNTSLTVRKTVSLYRQSDADRIDVTIFDTAYGQQELHFFLTEHSNPTHL